MHLNGRPVASFDPEGLIFAAGIDSRQLKLYDLRSFDKVWLILLNVYRIAILVYFHGSGTIFYLPCKAGLCRL